MTSGDQTGGYEGS